MCAVFIQRTIVRNAAQIHSDHDSVQKTEINLTVNFSDSTMTNDDKDFDEVTRTLVDSTTQPINTLENVIAMTG